MPKTPTSDSPTEQTGEAPLEDSFYEVPAELQDGEAVPRSAEAETVAGETTGEAVLRMRPRFPVVKVAIAVGVLVCIGAGLMVFRAQGRRRAVREGIARAEQLMRLDTADSYRRAADLLAPHAQLDPLQAGSARAFALAMLAADYRDTRAEADANALLVVPGRADAVPPHASLAFAALALGRNVLGDATSALGGVTNPWASALQARIALRAGTLDAAVEPATTAAAESGFAAGLAVHGDVARRARRDGATARASYEAALAVSPTHPRAAFGLAKLALAGQAPDAEAREALTRVIQSGAVTPEPERGRAALHLAALRLRAGDAVEVVRAELAGGLAAKDADWLMGAARAEAANRSAYRAVTGAPAPLESASDDDPPDLRPLAPEPPPPPPPPPKAVEPPKPPPSPKAGHASKAAVRGKTVKQAKPAKASASKRTAKPTAKPAAKRTTRRTH